MINNMQCNELPRSTYLIRVRIQPLMHRAHSPQSVGNSTILLRSLAISSSRSGTPRRASELHRPKPRRSRLRHIGQNRHTNLLHRAGQQLSGIAHLIASRCVELSDRREGRRSGCGLYRSRQVGKTEGPGRPLGDRHEARQAQSRLGTEPVWSAVAQTGIAESQDRIQSRAPFSTRNDIEPTLLKLQQERLHQKSPIAALNCSYRDST